MPEMVADLIREATQLQQAHLHTQLVSSIVYKITQSSWLPAPSTHKLHDLWPAMVAWSGAHEAPAEFREAIQGQLVHFFLERLGSAAWCQIVTGQRPMQATDCHALVERYLGLPDHEVPTLKELETVLLGSWDAGELVRLADSADLWEHLAVHSTLQALYRTRPTLWRDPRLSLDRLRQAIQQWVTTKAHQRAFSLVTL